MTAARLGGLHISGKSFLASLQQLVAQREGFLTRLGLEEVHGASIAAPDVCDNQVPDRSRRFSHTSMCIDVYRCALE